jgi:hypothetical protein
MYDKFHDNTSQYKERWKKTESVQLFYLHRLSSFEYLIQSLETPKRSKLKAKTVSKQDFNDSFDGAHI